MKTGKLINLVGFPEIIQIWVLAFWDINNVWTFIMLFVVFSSLLYFASPVELIFVIVFVLFH